MRASREPRLLDAAAGQQAGNRIRRQRDHLRELVRELRDAAGVLLAERLLLHGAKDQGHADELALVVLHRCGQEAAEERTVGFVAHAVADDRLRSVAALDQEGVGDAFEHAAHFGGILGSAVEIEVVARRRRERNRVAGHALLRFEQELSNCRRR